MHKSSTKRDMCHKIMIEEKKKTVEATDKIKERLESVDRVKEQVRVERLTKFNKSA